MFHVVLQKVKNNFAGVAMFILLLIFVFCTHMYNYGMKELYDQPPFLEQKKQELTAGFIRDNATDVPELCYAVSEDATNNPLLIVGLSPCVGAFVKSENSPKKILAFHISAHNSLDDMLRVINHTFDFGPSDKNKELYVTLFTHSSTKYREDPKLYTEKTHDARVEAIIAKLKENYNLKNSQRYMYITDPIEKYDSNPGAYNPYSLEDYAKDRNVICTGFDTENDRLKVYSIDLRKIDVFGVYNPNVINNFADQIIKTFCHENEELRKKEKPLCSDYKDRDAELSLGDKWDYQFFKITGPNIQLILRKVGDESLDAKKIADATSGITREITIRPDWQDTTKDVKIRVKNTGEVADILDVYTKTVQIPSDPDLQLIFKGGWFYSDAKYDETFGRDYPVGIVTPSVMPAQPKSIATKQPQPKPKSTTLLGNLKSKISNLYGGIKNKKHWIAGVLAVGGLGGLFAWLYYGGGNKSGALGDIHKQSVVQQNLFKKMTR
jgi:hypothetical protein